MYKDGSNPGLPVNICFFNSPGGIPAQRGVVGIRLKEGAMGLDIKAYLNERAAMVDDALDRIMLPADIYPATIHDAMRYSLFAGGKRLRPILVMATYEGFGKNPEDVLVIASTLEMIHTFTLIHDDLPCMDDAELRRGRATSHRTYGEDMAVLAGDALLNYAYEVIAVEGLKGGFPPDAVLKVIVELSSALGTQGVLGGQVVDVESAKREDVTDEELEYVHRHKTAAFFVGAMRIGGHLAGADSEQMALLDGFSDAFGLAFQIWDDVLDVTADVSALGKDVGHDADTGKKTFVSVYGLDKAKELARAQADRAHAALNTLGGMEALHALTEFIVTRGY
jgi:geranylgeranyl diphosphate synthase type II